MSVEGEQQDRPPTLATTADCSPPTSVVTWLHRLHTPLSHSSLSPTTLALFGESPARTQKRSLSPTSTPSDFLGDGPAYRKRRKLLQDPDVSITTILADSTTISERASSSRGRSPSRSPTATTMSGANPSTPNPSKKAKYIDPPNRLGLKMSLHGLMFEDDAFEEASQFKEMVEDILGYERGSAMRTQSVKRFRAALKEYQWSSEATFLHHIIPILHGYGYHVGKNPKLDQCVEKGELEWKEFLADEGVVCHWDKDFEKTLLPGKFDEDPSLTSELTKHLAKDAGMTNPRPDMLYALKQGKYPLASIPPKEILDLLEIVPGVHHPFLLIEGKSEKGSSATAANQARRGGTTLVKAARKLRAILEKGSLPGSASSANGDAPELEAVEAPESPDGSVAQLKQKRPIRPDLKSFVFSVTISPTHFTVWVHWYDEGNQLYHMNPVDSFAMMGAKGPKSIRYAMHNITQWGANDRAAQNIQLVQDIEAFSKAYSRQRAAEERVAQAAKEQAKADAKCSRSRGPSQSSSSPLKRSRDQQVED